jgi:purine-binding chemotaxis protein CheW
VLPIIDLADRLGFAPAEPTPRHVIIVTQTGKQVVGLLVDAVSDIIAMPADKVQPTPDVGSEAARTFVIGVMAIEDRMISLIALESVMPAQTGEAA